MKTNILIGSFLFLLVAYSVFNVFDALDTTRDKAQEYLVKSIGQGILNTGSSSIVANARKLPPERRVDGMRQLMKFAKEYTATDEFKKAYQQWRNEKINPDSKTKLGIPKFGKMLSNKINNQVDNVLDGEKYPKDPETLIKQRLQDFLELSNTVDFDARLTSSGRFADEAYEQKDPLWKMCFRAGRDVVQAAREEARQWLLEIDGK